jgi:hypothetical protein
MMMIQGRCKAVGARADTFRRVMAARNVKNIRNEVKITFLIEMTSCWSRQPLVSRNIPQVA